MLRGWLSKIGQASSVSSTRRDAARTVACVTAVRGKPRPAVQRSAMLHIGGSRLGEFWKYQVDDYRIIAHIEDGQLRILVVRIGNRREVYR